MKLERYSGKVSQSIDNLSNLRVHSNILKQRLREKIFYGINV